MTLKPLLFLSCAFIGVPLFIIMTVFAFTAVILFPAGLLLGWV